MGVNNINTICDEAEALIEALSVAYFTERSAPQQPFALAKDRYPRELGVQGAASPPGQHGLTRTFWAQPGKAPVGTGQWNGTQAPLNNTFSILILYLVPGKNFEDARYMHRMAAADAERIMHTLETHAWEAQHTERVQLLGSTDLVELDPAKGLHVLTLTYLASYGYDGL